VVSLIEIEQSPAELFIIWQILAPVTSPLTPWPWTYMVNCAWCDQSMFQTWARLV